MKIRIVFFCLIVWSEFSLACDFCNCYLGINPHYKKNSIGLRYNGSNYFGSHLSKSELETYNLTSRDFNETRTNYELYAQYYPVQKLQVQLFVPYVINIETMSEKAYNTFTQIPANTHRISHTEPAEVHTSSDISQSNIVKGIGDPLLLLNYQLYNAGTMDSTGIKQRLFAGIGIKFPVGKSKLESHEDPLEKMHQPGTGSWDILPSISYLAKYKAWGLNLNISYMITSKDKNEFKFSNRLNANLNVYREFKKGNFFMYPSLGAYLEQSGRDTYKAYSLEKSGGAILLTHLGLDFYYRKFSISTAFHLPTVQQLNGHQPQMQNRIILGLGYVFN